MVWSSGRDGLLLLLDVDWEGVLKGFAGERESGKQVTDAV